MIRKFECKKCKHCFEADDDKTVQCPNCGSDNVEYAHFHIQSKVWKILGILLAVVIIVITLTQIEWSCSGKQGEAIPEEKDSVTYAQDTTYIKETGLSLPSVINVGDLTFEENGYKFDVEVENPPSVKFYYAVVDPYNNKKIIAKSENGIFKDVPFSNADGGVYEVSLFDASSDTIICSIEKTGFIKQQAVAKKMTVAELQYKIDNRDASLSGVGENDYLSPDYDLKIIGLQGDAVNVPSTLGEVFEKIDNGIWESVKVNTLEYDKMNRIVKISISIKEL